MFAVLFGLTSALSWGAADFAGGIASRRTGAYRTVVFGETVGLAILIPVALIMGEPLPSARSWLLAALAGSLGTVGLLLLYHALATGTMSIAAPVSALMAAVMPVVFGSFAEGFPGLLTFLGFAFALAAVWLVSRNEDSASHVLTHLSDLRLPLLAGVGFGSYFVLMHAAAASSTYWPMVASRTAGWAVIALFILLRRDTWRVTRAAWLVILINGILDIGGNLFYILAGQVGRMDVAAVLSSLYPGATVLLAGIFLRERLSPSQWIGIGAALVAIVLLTL